MSQFLKGLNERQYEATKHGKGPMLVLAGAGSGKTRVLTHRIAHLIEQNVSPWNILAVTFTNKAANEMRERVVSMVGIAGESVWLSTFHSVCVRMLRKDIERLGYSGSFNIYDTDDQKRLMKSIFKERDTEEFEYSATDCLHFIEQAKLQPRRYEEICQYLQKEVDYDVEEIFIEYHRRMRQANAIDFNDIINFIVHIWQDHPEVLQRRQHQFRYILVDEYQDTNPTQYEFLRLLSGARKNIMVVGDDDQSIYGFRGADIESINKFVDDFHPEIVRLERNYRSHGNILAASNGVIANNRGRMEKKMWTDAPAGALIRTIEGTDSYSEARLVQQYILQLRSEGKNLSDIAIIYRTNAAAVVFESIFRRGREKIPCVVIGGQKFYDRKEIKDVLCYLKLLINPHDEISLKRALTSPKRGIGEKSLAEITKRVSDEKCSYIKGVHLWAGSSKGKAKQAARLFAECISETRKKAIAGLEPVEVLEQLLEDSGYREVMRASIDEHKKYLAELKKVKKPKHIREKHEDAILEIEGRLRNIEELKEELRNRFSAEDLSNTEEPLFWLQEFLDSVVLESVADKEDGRSSDKVTMLTAHSAKGLEFPIVFVTGLSHGVFPHERALKEATGKGIEEERRLAYVAFTRAKEQLILSRSETTLRMRDGDPALGKSIFWREIPKELLVTHKREMQRNTNRWTNKSNSSRFRQYKNPNKKTVKTKWVPDNFQQKLPKMPSGSLTTREVTSLDDLQPQTWIIHPNLGVGIIEARQATSQGLKLKVHFKKRGSIMISLHSHCQLEIIEI